MAKKSSLRKVSVAGGVGHDEIGPDAGVAAQMFDHLKFGASGYAASKAFSQQAMAPLGVRVPSEGEPAYGVDIAGDRPASLCLNQTSGPVSALHLAFRASTRQAVRDFHRAALAH